MMDPPSVGGKGDRWPWGVEAFLSTLRICVWEVPWMGCLAGMTPVSAMAVSLGQACRVEGCSTSDCQGAGWH